MAPLIGFFALGASLAALLCRFALPLGQWLGVMDTPAGTCGHKSHARPTPAVGGVIVAIVMSIVFVTSLQWAHPYVPGGVFIRAAALITVLMAMTIGFFDDRKHIPAVVRLVLGLLIAVALLIFVPELQLRRVAFPSIGLTLETGAFALPITTLCLLALKNAINMADGRNGLLLGMTVTWTVFFMFHALPVMVPTLGGLLGCVLVLFAFNWRGKLFMGDCGSYGVATYFGILALALHQNAFANEDARNVVRTSEVVLLFLIPVLDTIRLIVVRLANGQSPMAPDGQHLHHILDRSVGWTRGWIVYMALVTVPLVTYQLIPGKGVGIILAACAAYGSVVWGCRVARPRLSPTT